jgi:AcrR family transcriptional regulator
MSSYESETHRRILEAARQLMVERRGKDVRLEDVAKAAHVSRQAVYLHFGSRAGLLIATARYLDELLGLPERLRPVYEAENAVKALEAKVEFWARYIPDIYGLAKALVLAKDSDEAAAAAWQDRMQALYEGCLEVVERLEHEGLLAEEWTVKSAADYFYVTLSLTTWEQLIIERGWSGEEYIQWLKTALMKTLLKF